MFVGISYKYKVKIEGIVCIKDINIFFVRYLGFIVIDIREIYYIIKRKKWLLFFNRFDFS